MLQLHCDSRAWPIGVTGGQQGAKEEKEWPAKATGGEQESGAHYPLGQAAAVGCEATSAEAVVAREAARRNGSGSG